MGYHLAKRLCAILFAAVFLVVMTMSLVSPLFALFILGGYVIIVAVSISARAGPTMRIGVFTMDNLLAVILGTATSRWPDPDTLAKNHHRHLGSVQNNARPISAAMWPQISEDQPTSLNAYNARDQNENIPHLFNGNTAMSDMICGGRAVATRNTCPSDTIVLDLSQFTARQNRTIAVELLACAA